MKKAIALSIFTVLVASADEIVIYQTYDGTNAAGTAETIYYDEPGGGHRESGGLFTVSQANLTVTRLQLRLSLLEGASDDFIVGIYEGSDPTTPIARFFSLIPITSQADYSFYPTQAVLLAQSTFYSVVAEPAIVTDTYFFWELSTNIAVSAYDSYGGNPEWSPWEVTGSAPTVRVFGELVPEPSTLMLLATGCLGIGFRKLHRRGWWAAQGSNL